MRAEIIRKKMQKTVLKQGVQISNNICNALSGMQATISNLMTNLSIMF